MLTKGGLRAVLSAQRLASALATLGVHRATPCTTQHMPSSEAGPGAPFPLPLFSAPSCGFATASSANAHTAHAHKQQSKTPSSVSSFLSTASELPGASATRQRRHMKGPKKQSPKNKSSRPAQTLPGSVDTATEVTFEALQAAVPVDAHYHRCPRSGSLQLATHSPIVVAVGHLVAMISRHHPMHLLASLLVSVRRDPAMSPVLWAHLLDALSTHHHELEFTDSLVYLLARSPVPWAIDPVLIATIVTGLNRFGLHGCSVAFLAHYAQTDAHANQFNAASPAHSSNLVFQARQAEAAAAAAATNNDLGNGSNFSSLDRGVGGVGGGSAGVGAGAVSGAGAGVSRRRTPDDQVDYTLPASAPFVPSPGAYAGFGAYDGGRPVGFDADSRMMRMLHRYTFGVNSFLFNHTPRRLLSRDVHPIVSRAHQLQRLTSAARTNPHSSSNINSNNHHHNNNSSSFVGGGGRHGGGGSGTNDPGISGNPSTHANAAPDASADASEIPVWATPRALAATQQFTRHLVARSGSSSSTVGGSNPDAVPVRGLYNSDYLPWAGEASVSGRPGSASPPRLVSAAASTDSKNVWASVRATLRTDLADFNLYQDVSQFPAGNGEDKIVPEVVSFAADYISYRVHARKIDDFKRDYLEWSGHIMHVRLSELYDSSRVTRAPPEFPDGVVLRAGAVRLPPATLLASLPQPSPSQHALLTNLHLLESTILGLGAFWSHSPLYWHAMSSCVRDIGGGFWDRVLSHNDSHLSGSTAGFSSGVGSALGFGVMPGSLPALTASASALAADAALAAATAAAEAANAAAAASAAASPTGEPSAECAAAAAEAAAAATAAAAARDAVPRSPDPATAAVRSHPLLVALTAVRRAVDAADGREDWAVRFPAARNAREAEQLVENVFLFSAHDRQPYDDAGIVKLYREHRAAADAAGAADTAQAAAAARARELGGASSASAAAEQEAYSSAAYATADAATAASSAAAAAYTARRSDLKNHLRGLLTFHLPMDPFGDVLRAGPELARAVSVQADTLARLNAAAAAAAGAPAVAAGPVQAPGTLASPVLQDGSVSLASLVRALSTAPALSAPASHAAAAGVSAAEEDALRAAAEAARGMFADVPVPRLSSLAPDLVAHPHFKLPPEDTPARSEADVTDPACAPLVTTHLTWRQRDYFERAYGSYVRGVQSYLSTSQYQPNKSLVAHARWLDALRCGELTLDFPAARAAEAARAAATAAAAGGSASARPGVALTSGVPIYPLASLMYTNTLLPPESHYSGYVAATAEDEAGAVSAAAAGGCASAAALRSLYFTRDADAAVAEGNGSRGERASLVITAIDKLLPSSPNAADTVADGAASSDCAAAPSATAPSATAVAPLPAASPLDETDVYQSTMWARATLASSLYFKGTALGLPMNTPYYSQVIALLSRSGDLQRLLSVTRDMTARGYTAGSSFFSALIRLAVVEGRSAAEDSLYSSYLLACDSATSLAPDVEGGMLPSMSLLVSVASAHARQGDLFKTLQWTDRALLFSLHLTRVPASYAAEARSQWSTTNEPRPDDDALHPSQLVADGRFVPSITGPLAYLNITFGLGNAVSVGAAIAPRQERQYIALIARSYPFVPYDSPPVLAVRATGRPGPRLEARDDDMMAFDADSAAAAASFPRLSGQQSHGQGAPASRRLLGSMGLAPSLTGPMWQTLVTAIIGHYMRISRTQNIDFFRVPDATSLLRSTHTVSDGSHRARYRLPIVPATLPTLSLSDLDKEESALAEIFFGMVTTRKRDASMEAAASVMGGDGFNNSSNSGGGALTVDLGEALDCAFALAGHYRVEITPKVVVQVAQYCYRTRAPLAIVDRVLLAMTKQGHLLTAECFVVLLKVFAFRGAWGEVRGLIKLLTPHVMESRQPAIASAADASWPSIAALELDVGSSSSSHPGAAHAAEAATRSTDLLFSTLMPILRAASRLGESALPLAIFNSAVNSHGPRPRLSHHLAAFEALASSGRVVELLNAANRARNVIGRLPTRAIDLSVLQLLGRMGRAWRLRGRFPRVTPFMAMLIAAPPAPGEFNWEQLKQAIAVPDAVPASVSRPRAVGAVHIPASEDEELLHQWVASEDEPAKTNALMMRTVSAEDAAVLDCVAAKVEAIEELTARWRMRWNALAAGDAGAEEASDQAAQAGGSPVSMDDDIDFDRLTATGPTAHGTNFVDSVTVTLTDEEVAEQEQLFAVLSLGKQFAPNTGTRIDLFRFRAASAFARQQKKHTH